MTYRTAAAAWVCVALGLLLAGCGGGGGGATAPVTRIPDAERPFLVEPLTAYPRTVDSETRAALRASYGALDGARDLEWVEQEAQRLLAIQPGLHPAVVLAAQVATLRGLLPTAAERLRPVVDELPDYLAAALLLARLEERLDRVPEAYAIYRRLADFDRVAAARTEDLREPAEKEVFERLVEAIDAERLDEAQTALERLETWSPGARDTLEAARRLAVATEDTAAELEVLRRLIALEPDVDTRRRLAELEVEVGDLRAGIDLLEALLEERLEGRALEDRGLEDRALEDRGLEDPALERAALEEALERANFKWSLELLPESVRGLRDVPELRRAGLAQLIHWLVPTVRVWVVDDPPIASDITRRDPQSEILRVLDLDLMQVDESVHRFYPERPALRADALGAVLALIGGAEPPAACLPDGVPHRRGQRWICDAALACGLIDAEEDCLPALPVSGAEAVEIVRRGMDRVEP